MKTASLFTAYEWICDECGHRNFCSSMHLDKERALANPPPIGHPDRAAFDDFAAGIAEGEWVTIPTHVVCAACRERFETIDHREGGDEDAEGDEGKEIPS